MAKEHTTESSLWMQGVQNISKRYPTQHLTQWNHKLNNTKEIFEYSGCVSAISIINIKSDEISSRKITKHPFRNFSNVG